MHLSDLMQHERKIKKINRLLLAVMGLITAGCGVLGLHRGDNYAAFQAALALFMFTFPSLITRFLHFIIPQDCRLIYYVFTFSTIVVGSAMYGYSHIPYWDKLFHFFSGILISAAGLIVCHLLFHTLSGAQRARRTLYVLFPFFFNLSAAVLWEVYEYMLYILFGIDAVNHLTSGVHDTMQDMIVCLIGGLLFTCSLLRGFHKGKNGYILNICTHFFNLRGQELEL